MNTVRLGDVGEIITGNTPKTSELENYKSNDICFIKPSDFIENSINYINNSEFYISDYAKRKARILPPNSVLVTCIGIIGKVGINKIECAFNQQINAIIPNLNKSMSSYLAYAIEFKKYEMQKIANAPVVPILNKSQFSDIKINLPPLEEQKRIANILDKVTELIQKRKKQLDKLDLLVKAKFVEMFGDPLKNERGWKVMLLIDATNKITSGLTPKGGKQNYISEGISLVRSMNVYDGLFKYKELAHITEEQARQLENVIIEKEDVLINITGASVTRCCIVPNDILPAPVNQHVMIVRCLKDILNNLFLNYQFINGSYKSKLIHIAEASGATRQALKKQQIENLKIIVPPIELQEQFANLVMQTEKSKIKINESLEKLETLKKALMQQYFN